jgi:uncharacterized protein (TIGR02996 family)
VNEDETFIRAIVDAPGDETARLVYADWLDDRADPRSAYLRAEVEWAKPWRDGTRPVESPELRKLATGLDPVWVARVSRPPVGVCSATSLFRRFNPPATAEAVDALADEFGVILPPPYRAFLLNYNGGWFAVFPEDEEPDESNEVLASVESTAEFARWLFANCHEHNRRCGLFPIGGLPGASGHNTLIGVAYPGTPPSNLFGRVFASCRENEPWLADGEFIEVEHWDQKLADSLPALFARWKQETGE